MNADTVLRCDCGFEASGADEDDLVGQVQRHAWEAHGMALSQSEALLLAFRAELRQTPPPAIPPSQSTGGTT